MLTSYFRPKCPDCPRVTVWTVLLMLLYVTVWTVLLMLLYVTVWTVLLMLLYVAVWTVLLMLLYGHRSRRLIKDGEPRTATSSFTQL